MEAMNFGQVLQRRYRVAQDEERSKTLVDMFSVIACNSLKDTVYRRLQIPVAREIVAQNLHSAIVASHGQWFSANCFGRKSSRRRGEI